MGERHEYSEPEDEDAFHRTEEANRIQQTIADEKLVREDFLVDPERYDIEHSEVRFPTCATTPRAECDRRGSRVSRLESGSWERLR